jgi:hypothetical protein
MAYTQEDLERARRHVAEGERHVVSQEEIVSRLEVQGHPTEFARELLAEFNSTLADQRRHLHLIEADLEVSGEP